MSVFDLAESQLRVIAKERQRKQGELRKLERLDSLIRREVIQPESPVTRKRGKRRATREGSVVTKLSPQIVKVLQEKGKMKVTDIRAELKTRGIRATQEQVRRVLYAHKDVFYRPSRGQFATKTS